MEKTDRCVVRNAAYRKSGIGIRERHNERKNMGYSNSDIDMERSSLNVHFKECESTYVDCFEGMINEGIISMRGLKQDAKVIDELVFDVNSAYFDRGGGYEYAKCFFAEAYKLAVREVGDEKYILSAVMHADERNKALSEQLGRDVYHYHLHVVYVPVVDKVVKWSKRCKSPELVGTTKETIHQVSHSKKWASEKAVDKEGAFIRNENGGVAFVNAYSVLQDSFFEHMRAAGYNDLQRGERGSTAPHLSVLDYKVKQDAARLSALDKEVNGKKKQAIALDKNMAAKEKQIINLETRLNVDKRAHAMYKELECMGKKDILGRIVLQNEEWDKLISLAREGLSVQGKVIDLETRLAEIGKSAVVYRERWNELKERTKDYLKAERLYPEQTHAAIKLLQRSQEPRGVYRQTQRENYERGR